MTTPTATTLERRKLRALSIPELLTEARDREQAREVAETAANEAAERRNAVLLELHQREGVRNAEIAEAIGRSPARVGQLLDRLSPETRQRAGRETT